LTTPGPVLERFSPFRAFLDEPADPHAVERLRAAASIGRPVGDKAFLARLERLTKRTLRPAKRGPKPRPDDVRQGRLI
jgi:putative transposase